MIEVRNRRIGTHRLHLAVNHEVEEAKNVAQAYLNDRLWKRAWYASWRDPRRRQSASWNLEWQWQLVPEWIEGDYHRWLAQYHNELSNMRRDIYQSKTYEDCDKLLVRLDGIKQNYDEKEAIDTVRQQVEDKKKCLKDREEDSHVDHAWRIALVPIYWNWICVFVLP